MKFLHHWLLGIRPAFFASFLKKLLRIKRRLISTNEGIFFIDPLSNFGNAILAKGGYEPQLVASVKSILKKGDTFLDVGANEGFFSIIASRSVGKSGKVICIEPQSRLQGVIFRNILENNSYNIEVLQRAISNEIGMATISLSPDMNTGSSGLFRTTKYRNPTEIVPQITLIELIRTHRIEKIRLMKMDIEGLEYEAILGSRDIFENAIIENIALELHPSTLKQRRKSELDILSFLKNCGYYRNEEHETLILSKRLDKQEPAPAVY